MRILKRDLQLTREIEANEMLNAVFGTKPPNDQSLETLNYPFSTLRYVTVSRMSGPIAYFRDAYEAREKFGPIQLPKLLWGLIRRDDTFLACIAREEDRLEILFLSELTYKLP